ncbi:hypothetical protein FMEXI_4205 [Fusarium mexicanum]|uniref:Uncharacterized protein n=1 Tax=Fusarium mexicanum TaxID=751941 RepID=A0A8H5N2T5_9HYPO|nr:hypothetical protein FMEXI_4205 [Fusarium mexicanum]
MKNRQQPLPPSTAKLLLIPFLSPSIFNHILPCLDLGALPRWPFRATTRWPLMFCRKPGCGGPYHVSSACYSSRDLNLRESDVTISAWRAPQERRAAVADNILKPTAGALRKLEEDLDEKLREVKRLKQKLDEKTEGVKRLKEKLDEKTLSVERLKNEIGQRKNKWRGLLDSVVM